MAQPIFFEKPPPATLAEVAALTEAQLADPARGGLQDHAALPRLTRPGPMHLTFFDNLKYADQLAQDQGRRLPGQRPLRERACRPMLRCCAPRSRSAPSCGIAREWHGDALRPKSWFAQRRRSHPRAIIDPSAHLEDGVIVDPLAVIGPEVEIGAGTVIGAAAVIGAGRQDRPRLQCRRPLRDPGRADRQQCADPSGLQHRPGRLWLRLLRAARGI